MTQSPFETTPAKITVRPPQFGLRTLLIAAAGIGLTFGVLGWFQVSAAVGFFVLAILVVAAIATAGLMAALLQAYTTIETPAKPEPKHDEAFDPFGQSDDMQSEH
jgi:thiol:disulfide interchange protein